MAARLARTRRTSAYAGQHWDWDEDLGLSYAQQRWYDARSGRFLSEDPVGWNAERLSQPTRGHAFGYAAGNPLLYTDPQGLAGFACRRLRDNLAGGLLERMPPHEDLMSRRGWWGVAASVIAVVLLGAWPISHHVPWGGHAARLWSERDLPRLPDERENGWMPFEATALTLRDDVPPRELRDLLEPLEWPRLVATSESIRTFADDAAVRAADAAARTALASPRFADACAIEAATRCRYPEAMRLHDVVVLGALSSALKGHWRAAFETAGVLLRADLDLLRTTRSAISALVAQRRLRRDLHLVEALLDGASGAHRNLAKPRADLEAIASILDGGVGSATDIERAIITEYVFVTKAIRQVSGSAKASAGAEWWMPIFLDAERTCELANRHFETLMRFGEAPSTREPPPLPRYSRTHLGWWAYNAGGKLVLDAALVDLVPAIRLLERQEVEIAAAWTGARQRVRRWLESLPEDLPPQGGERVPASTPIRGG